MRCQITAPEHGTEDWEDRKRLRELSIFEVRESELWLRRRPFQVGILKASLPYREGSLQTIEPVKEASLSKVAWRGQVQAGEFCFSRAVLFKASTGIRRFLAEVSWFSIVDKVCRKSL